MILNTAKSILNAIEVIAATPGKKEKEALIRELWMAAPLFQKAVTYTYDRFKNYGISVAPHKTPGVAPGGNKLEESIVWRTLDDLIARRLSGTSARDTIQNMVNLLDDASSDLFRRIINLDMRAGFTDGTINRLFPGTFQEFPYMRCSLPEKSNMPKWDWLQGIFVQEKADGMFLNVNKDHTGHAWIITRQGQVVPREQLQDLHNDLEKTLLEATQTHGEAIVFEDGKMMTREDGNGVMNHVAGGGTLAPNQRVVFFAWDQIPLASVVPGGSYNVGYKQRFVAVARQCLDAGRAGIVSVRAIPTKVVKSKAEAYAYYRELLKQKKEGVVCKHPEAIWKDTTSKDQVKLKLTAVVDLRIKGFVPGKPGTKTEATFGSLLCQTECGKLEVAVSGITDAKRKEIHENRDKYLETILAVASNSVMLAPEDEHDAKASLFLPRVSEFRIDKTVADTLEEVQEQFAAAMEAA